MRTRLRAREEYERAWSGVRSAIDRKLAAGERDPVNILDSLWTDQSRSLFTERQFKDHYALLGIRSDQRGMPNERVVVREGVYRLLPFDEPGELPHIDILASFLDEHSDRFDCVVELGSGYGRNLLKLHHLCGKETNLHACEPTDAARPRPWHSPPDPPVRLLHAGLVLPYRRRERPPSYRPFHRADSRAEPFAIRRGPPPHGELRRLSLRARRLAIRQQPARDTQETGR
jgi:hypothetical protein